jgi:hypothetical protein
MSSAAILFLFSLSAKCGRFSTAALCRTASSAYIATIADTTDLYRFPAKGEVSVHPAAAAAWPIPPLIWLTAYCPKFVPVNGF